MSLRTYFLGFVEAHISSRRCAVLSMLGLHRFNTCLHSFRLDTSGSRSFERSSAESLVLTGMVTLLGTFDLDQKATKPQSWASKKAPSCHFPQLEQPKAALRSGVGFALNRPMTV